MSGSKPKPPQVHLGYARAPPKVGPPSESILCEESIDDAKTKRTQDILKLPPPLAPKDNFVMLTMPSVKKENEQWQIQLHCRVLPGTSTSLRKVALISDEDILLHEPPDSEFDETPERLTRIMNKLKEENLCDRCDLFKPDEVSTSYLLAVHSQWHVKHVESIVTKSQQQRNGMAKRQAPHGDIYYSEGSTRAALLAAGGSVKACTLVVEGFYRYSFALVRPPGQHAGKGGPSGFCLFNNISVAASYLLNKY